MKKVIVFRVEDVLVKDFNKEESLKRAISVETNKLKKSVGLDVLERELKKQRNDKNCEAIKEKMTEKWNEIAGKVREMETERNEWVERKEREFYDKEFERSKFRNGVEEVMKVLKGIKERKGVEVVFVSDHRKSKVESILWSNGLRDFEVENCNGDWIGRVSERSGKSKGDMIMLSNKESDLKNSVEWGIKVDRIRMEQEGVSGFMGKIGLKQCA